MADRTTYQEVLSEYAEACGKRVDGLTEAEKRQAFLNAIISGVQVEPFASWNDLGDAVLSLLAPGRETLNQMVRRLTAKGENDQAVRLDNNYQG